MFGNIILEQNVKQVALDYMMEDPKSPINMVPQILFHAGFEIAGGSLLRALFGQFDHTKHDIDLFRLADPYHEDIVHVMAALKVVMAAEGFELVKEDQNETAYGFYTNHTRFKYTNGIVRLDLVLAVTPFFDPWHMWSPLSLFDLNVSQIGYHPVKSKGLYWTKNFEDGLKAKTVSWVGDIICETRAYERLNKYLQVLGLGWKYTDYGKICEWDGTEVGPCGQGGRYIDNEHDEAANEHQDNVAAELNENLPDDDYLFG